MTIPSLSIEERLHGLARRAQHPHKPLLLLLALHELAHSPELPRLRPYDHYRAPLQALLRIACPDTVRPHPEEPFFRLPRNGLWEVIGVDEAQLRSSRVRTFIRKEGVVGGLLYEDHVNLLADPVRRQEVTRALLGMVDQLRPGTGMAIAEALSLENGPFAAAPVAPFLFFGDPPVPRRQGEKSRRRRVAPAGLLAAADDVKKAVGMRGEVAALAWERQRLDDAGRGDLAAAVEHSSIERGDGLGYDIQSFDANGDERYIEVKTTTRGPATPFFISRTELEASQDLANYWLYRVHSLSSRPALWVKHGPLDSDWLVEPHTYVVVPDSVPDDQT